MQRARTSCCKSDDGEGSAQFAHDFAITGTVENGEFQVVRCKVCAGWGDAGHGATAAPRLTQRNNHRAAIGHAEAVSRGCRIAPVATASTTCLFPGQVPDAISRRRPCCSCTLVRIRNRDFLSFDDKRRRNRGSTLLSFRLFRWRIHI